MDPRTFPQTRFYADADGHIVIADKFSSEDDSSPIKGESEVGSDGESDIHMLGRHALGLTRFYVPAWRCQDAFRELYQNWYLISSAACACPRGNS